MRRALVLTNEAARHPFRRLLPPHVTKAERPAREEPSLKLFAVTFTGWFVVIYGFIV